MGFVVGTGASSPEPARGGTGLVTAVTGNTITVAKDANSFVAGQKLKVDPQDNSITTWTWSGWVKLSSITSSSQFFGARNSDGSENFQFYFNYGDKKIYVYTYDNILVTDGAFLETAGWTHMVLAVDSTQVVPSNRMKLYFDGELAKYGFRNEIAKNESFAVNSLGPVHGVGYRPVSEDTFTDGYMTDVNFVDGAQLEPKEFGSSLNGKWEPKRYHGRYGVFGWNLYGEGDDEAFIPETSDIIDVEVTGTTAGSPMGNYNVKTSDNISYNGSMTQATWELLQADPNWNATNPDYNKTSTAASLGDGEPYFYITGTARCRFNYTGADLSKDYFMLTDSGTGATTYVYDLEGDIAPANGQAQQTGTAGRESETKDVAYFKLTKVNGYFDIYLPTGNFMMKFLNFSSGIILTFEDNTNLDIISVGSTVEQIGEAIPETPAFTTTLYTGTGNSGNVVDAGIDFSDTWLIWLKARSQNQNHYLTDSLMVKTTGEYPSLNTNTTSAQATTAGPVDITGTTFTYAGSTNDSSETYVAWSFRGAPGFMDVIRWDGDGNSNMDIPHNLQSTPAFAIVKNYNTSTYGWYVYHRDLGINASLRLDNNSVADSGAYWGNMTDTTFGATQYVNHTQVGYENVAYLFAETPGKIKCGSATLSGGSATVTTGFRPGWILVKTTSASGSWMIIDSERGNSVTLKPDVVDGEGSAATSTFSDTGFSINFGSSQDFIYIAIAEDLEVGGLNPSGEVTETSTTDNTLTISNVSGTWEVGGTATGDLAFPGNLDDSGNANNWTGAGFDESDVKSDSPDELGSDTGVGGEVVSNYATMNPLSAGSNVIVMDGALNATNLSGSRQGIGSTIGVSSGKWYCEVKVNAVGDETKVGIGKRNALALEAGSQPDTWAYTNVGAKMNSNSDLAYGSTFTNGDVIGIAFDADNGDLYFYKNGVSQGLAYSGLLDGDYFFHFTLSGIAPPNNLTVNFGATAFQYPAPDGYKCLTTGSVPGSLFPNGELGFGTVLYTGSGKEKTVGGLSFQPDFVWIKSRNNTWDHALYDSVRGPLKRVRSSQNFTEITDTGTLLSFNDDGFTVGTENVTNNPNDDYVAWCWKGSNQTTTNVNGSIISQVSANPTTGFSVVTYTGTGSNATIGHGLGAPAKMILVKNRDKEENWAVYHVGAQETGANIGILNDTGVFNANTTVWQNIQPGSATFSVGSNIKSNGSTDKMVAYCWSEVPGYSNFGEYTGGPLPNLIYTGFKPAFVLIKSYEGDGFNWVIIDDVRGTTGDDLTYKLYPNLDAVENGDSRGQETRVVFTDNGFVFVGGGAETYDSSRRYVYAAFAEKPFTTGATTFSATTFTTTRSRTFTGPFAIQGYYPLYLTETGANAASPSGSSHTHEFYGRDFYMPNGVTIYHGTYGDTATSAPITQATVSPTPTPTPTSSPEPSPSPTPSPSPSPDPYGGY